MLGDGCTTLADTRLSYVFSFQLLRFSSTDEYIIRKFNVHVITHLYCYGHVKRRNMGFIPKKEVET